MAMTNKQKRFCDEYLVDMNATQAAVRSGYSKKTAKQIGRENLTKPYIKKYIDERMAEKEESLIAKQDEVLSYLTSILRGETEAEEIVVEGVGDGCSEARRMMKGPSEKERIKAAELLGKAHGTFTDRMSINGNIPVVISGADDIED